MNCQKCGTKVKVIESRKKDGSIHRREYCPTCRFESARLVPKEIRFIRSGYNPSSMKMFLSAEDGKEYVIKDIRGSAQVWTENWKKRLLACKGHELDAAGKDLREMWPRASKNYCTRREDHWHDEKYREELLCAILGMAADRIARWEAKSPTVPSPKTAEERQKKESKRPQGRPGDWWLNSPLDKPAMVSIGQRWLRYDKEPVVITVTGKNYAEYRPVNALLANGCLNKVLYDIILAQDNGQWKFFGYEPNSEKSEPIKSYGVPDRNGRLVEIKPGQKWRCMESPATGATYIVKKINSCQDGFTRVIFEENGWDFAHVMLSGKYELVSEPESKTSLPEIKVGQKWSFKPRANYEKEFTVRAIDEKISRVYFVGHDDSYYEHASIMAETGSPWTLVHEPLIENRPKPTEISSGQVWQYLDGSKCVVQKIVKRESDRDSVVYFFGSPNPPYSTVASMLDSDSWKFIQHAKNVG